MWTKINKKMCNSITALIAVVSIICITVLFFSSNSNMSRAMSETAKNNIITSLNSKTQTIEEYISNAETTLFTFAKSRELIEYLKDIKNEEKAKRAQDYTTEFYDAIGEWEGIYLCTWESEVMTHSNPSAIGMILREGDSLDTLHEQIKGAKSGVFNTGIIVSPASGQLVVSIYTAVYDGDEIIGFVGGATLASGLKTLLDESKIEGLENAEYSLINTETGVYIFDKDESLINTSVTSDALLKTIENVKSGTETDIMEYTENGTDYFSVYKSLSDRGWVLVIRDKSDEIFSYVNNSRRSLGIICILAVIVISLLSWVVIRWKTRPLTEVAKSIDQLKNLNLKSDEKIKKYRKQKDEVGSIAQAIDSLSETFGSIIDTLNKCSESLADSSEIMGNTSQELMGSVENNAATTEELSASIVNTNEAIEHMTKEMFKMKDMVSHIECCVKDGNDSSEQLSHAANEMTQMANHTLVNSEEKIKVTKIQIDEALSNLQTLNKINDMASQILDITNQTNLLSLNASIEAARAGEAGRGFAVVANEIANLAKDSSDAVTHIQEICLEANQSIEKVRECFVDVIHFLEGDISTQLSEFADVSSKYEKVVSEIQSAIETIDGTTSVFVDSVTNIMEQVENINSASNDNAAGVDDIIRKNNETTITVDSVLEAAEENRKNAGSLKDIIDRFTR